MEMRLDITAHNPSQRPDQIINLSRIRTADRIGHTNSVDAYLIDRTVDGEKVDEFGSERIFGGETDFDSFGFDELNDFDGAKSSVSEAQIGYPGCWSGAGENTYVLVIQVMSLPWECSRRNEEVPMTTSTPSTPVSPISFAPRYQSQRTRLHS